MTINKVPAKRRILGAAPDGVVPSLARLQRVIIVGGGASGVLLAIHLLRESGAALEVVLIERDVAVGKGLAYGTTHPRHLLNVRAASMSAFADEPDHFTKWLAVHDSATGIANHAIFFVERRLYAAYLESLIQPYLAPQGHLSLRHAEAVAIEITFDAAVVWMGDGTRLAGDVVVLATGYDGRPEQRLGHPFASPWLLPGQGGVHRAATVAIRGTGLTMIDYVLALAANGHRGPIYALSRHGCLPRVHRVFEPLHLKPTDIPFGTNLVTLWRWFRALVRDHAKRSGDWRACVDALRPHTWALWRRLPIESQRRFLRHARAWWDVHRHRMAPDVQGRIDWLIASGQLQVIAAKITDVDADGERLRVSYRRRGRSAIETLAVDRFVDCSGVQSDPRQSPNPVIRHLIAKGLARSDPLNLGLEVSGDWALIDGRGSASHRLYAIGPLTCYAGWETTAIPDIRRQCGELALRLRDPSLRFVVPARHEVAHHDA